MIYMKNILYTIILSFLFSSSVFGDIEWEFVARNIGSNNPWYVDFNRIRKHNGYFYWWDLEDDLVAQKNNSKILSSMTYKQGDCKLFRVKILIFHFHSGPMGTGAPDIQEPVGVAQNWLYPPPGSVAELMLKSVCSQ